MESTSPSAHPVVAEDAKALPTMPDSWAGLSASQRAFSVGFAVVSLVYCGSVGPGDFFGKPLAHSLGAHVCFAAFGAIAGFALSIFAINASYTLFPLIGLLWSLVKWFLRALPTLIVIGLVVGAIWGIGAWLFAIPSWAAVIIVLLVLVVLK